MFQFLSPFDDHVSEEELEDAGGPADRRGRGHTRVIYQSMGCAGVLAHLSEFKSQPEGVSKMADSSCDDDDDDEQEVAGVVQRETVSEGSKLVDQQTQAFPPQERV